MLEVFERQVDPEGILPPTERAKRAENARKAQLARARLKASRKRQETAALARADFARTKLVEEALQAPLDLLLQGHVSCCRRSRPEGAGTERMLPSSRTALLATVIFLPLCRADDDDPKPEWS
jgi:hypothetical protein